MGVHRVVDVHHVDAILPATHNAQPPGSRPRQDARNQMRISLTPDEVGPQRHRPQVRSIGSEDLTFGLRLRERVSTRATRGQRQRLVRIPQVATVVHHARGTGVHQAPHAVATTPRDHRPRAEHVGAEKILVPTQTPTFAAT
jgi:hypothetical protein